MIGQSPIIISLWEIMISLREIIVARSATMNAIVLRSKIISNHGGAKHHNCFLTKT